MFLNTFLGLSITDFFGFVCLEKELLSPTATEKLKISIFEIPIIPQTLHIVNKQRTIGVKSINLGIIRKFIECSLKNVLVMVIFKDNYFGDTAA